MKLVKCRWPCEGIAHVLWSGGRNAVSRRVVASAHRLDDHVDRVRQGLFDLRCVPVCENPASRIQKRLAKGRVMFGSDTVARMPAAEVSQAERHELGGPRLRLPESRLGSIEVEDDSARKTALMPSPAQPALTRHAFRARTAFP